MRQSAEDKAVSYLFSLRPLKVAHPQMVINLMGCMVSVKGYEHLRKRFPFVDVFSPPSDPGPLLAYLTQEESRQLEQTETESRFAHMDGELSLPLQQRGSLVATHVPVVLGCSHACTFCIIPYRRGVERSRRVGDILSEVRSLVAQGVKEITLLGQIVDRNGKDIPDGPDLFEGRYVEIREIVPLEPLVTSRIRPLCLSNWVQGGGNALREHQIRENVKPNAPSTTWIRPICVSNQRRRGSNPISRD